MTEKPEILKLVMTSSWFLTFWVVSGIIWNFPFWLAGLLMWVSEIAREVLQ